ncbi:50S ribosomal protein L3 [Candidatus Daviesbacteria bacterium]|nr:50S ribosomal protein L3 [Candidatus Daviesbacteria bacterium]
MFNTLFGIKKNMTSTYDSRGRRVGATALQIGPNFVTQVNSNSVQLGFGTKKSVKKPQIGHGKKAGIEQPLRWFREIEIMEDPSTPSTSLRTGPLGTIQPGTEIKLDQVFSIGDSIKVSGVSKGRGFAGVVKRHGFHGGPRTHGQSDRQRAPGAIGSGTTPGRVYKGKKMAGHMGSASVSVRNLEVVGIDKVKGYLIVKGAVPGPIGGLVTVTKFGRVKGYTPPPEEKVDEEEEGASDKSEVSESADKQTTDTPISSDTPNNEGGENAKS